MKEVKNFYISLVTISGKEQSGLSVKLQTDLLTHKKFVELELVDFVYLCCLAPGFTF